MEIQPIKPSEINETENFAEFQRMLNHYTLKINNLLKSGIYVWEIPLRLEHQFQELVRQLVSIYSEYWKINRRVGRRMYIERNFLEFIAR